MLTGSGVEVEDKPLEIAGGTEFSRYCDSGGRLPEAFYKKVQEALQNINDKGQPFGEPDHKKLAAYYAKLYRLEWSQQLEFLYCFLRETRIPISLTDQQAMVEAFLITKDKAQYLKLASVNSNFVKK